MNTANPSHVKHRNRRERRARERELADVRSVMATAEGRRVVLRVLSFAGIFKTSMTGNAYTYFNEGARNVGLMLQADVMEACPDAFLQAMTEAKQTQKKEDETEDAILSTPEMEDHDG